MQAKRNENLGASKFFEKVRILAMFAGLVYGGVTIALPVVDKVASGDVNIEAQANALQINQSSDKAIVNWNSFNIDAAEKVHFQQPANGVCLNRIDSANGMSQIAGQLSATDKIMLINGAGIVFGESSQVKVGSIITSATDISDANFAADNLRFDQGNHVGAIINRGSIKADDMVVLFGSNVVNTGVIEVNAGKVSLISGSKVTVDYFGGDILTFGVEPIAHSAVDENGVVLPSAIDMSGKIFNDNGTVYLVADASNTVFDNLINMSGEIQAKSIEQSGSSLILGDSKGTIRISGKIDASSTLSDSESDNTIDILGKDIILDSNAVLDVSGHDDANAGSISLGLTHAIQVDTLKLPATDTIYVGPKVLVDLSADSAGKRGGLIDIEARQNMQVDGTIKVAGGEQKELAAGISAGYPGLIDITGLNDKTNINVDNMKTDLSNPDEYASRVRIDTVY